MVSRIEKYLSQLAPHVRDREAAKLLIDALAEINRLRLDEHRINWLADKNNTIGNVQLPSICVTRNLHSLRAAIDDAMLIHNNES